MLDFDDYNRQLDEALGQANLGAGNGATPDPQGAVPVSPTDQNAPAPTGNLMGSSGPQQPPAGGSNLGAGDQPANQSLQQRPDQAQQKTQIPVVPPGKPLEFDQAKLAKAKSLEDHVDAMKPSSQTRFMDWWQKQYGSINDHYDHMQDQLGQRPDPDAAMSKKDKWVALMNFGLNLIKSSAPTNGTNPSIGGAVSNAVGDTVAQTNLARQGSVNQYDKNQADIEEQRQGALKNLGTEGEAMKSQSSIDANQARQDMYNRPRPPPKPEAPIGTDQGLIQRDETGKWDTIKGPNGKPYTNLQVGSKGGTKDSRTASEKVYDRIVALGHSKDEAYQVAFTRSTGDPKKDYLSVYSKQLTSTMGDTKAATEAAQTYVGEIYGEDALANAKTHFKNMTAYQKPGVTSSMPTPPASMLKSGVIRPLKDPTSGAVTRWTLDANGQPKQVK